MGLRRLCHERALEVPWIRSPGGMRSATLVRGQETLLPAV
jgi:hypothetical protein